MNPVEAVLLENAAQPASLFVFPTDVAASRWADRLLHLYRTARQYSGSVAMERFIAWDTFKQNAIRSKVQNKKSIPAVLRKMFVSALVRENADLCGKNEPPVFTSLIHSEWAGQADSFAGWLTAMLPQLGAWFRQSAGQPWTPENIAARTADCSPGDNRDLYTLMYRYTQFLNEHGLFEPAWETPPFEDTGRECFVFFPESLSDFSEYKDLLAASSHVHTVSAGPEWGDSNIFFYTNSRSEITEAALYILALRQRRQLSWDSISVSMADEENYGPYLYREFTNRNIPYVRQSGKPLASYPAGKLFAALADCASAGMPFDALKALLLNRHLPWKNNDHIQALINFGINNNCISSWTEEADGKTVRINVWEDAFERPFEGYRPEVRAFFYDLQRHINAMRGAASFSAIRKHYFAFRERFFDMENCLEETDLILSRCISELMYLTEIEKSFPNVHVPDPYMFFAGYLREVNYLAQQSGSGVAILPYRTAAPAPFDCHIVLGASQTGLSALFSPMAFLSRKKREQLGIAENDASLAFINLHRFNSRLPAAFFCSEQTFSGYAIPHSALDAGVTPRQSFRDDPQWSEQFAGDLYRLESDRYHSMCGHGQAEFTPPPAMHLIQKRGFEAWKLRRNRPAECGGGISGGVLRPDHPLPELIRLRFCRNEQFPGKLSVSSSALAPYFHCPLILIFSQVLNIKNVTIETGLMAHNIAGQVYHAVLNLFLSELKKNGEVISGPITADSGKKSIHRLPAAYAGLLTKNIETVFSSFPKLPDSKYQIMSMLTARLLHAEKPLFHTVLENFLAEFTARFAGFAVAASEGHYFLPEEHYFLNGRIDCILERENTVTIVDFKTKKTPKPAECVTDEGLADFQLPLYRRLAESALGKEVHSTLFMSITDTTITDSALTPAIMREFDHKTEQFVQELSGGIFSFALSHNSGQCRDCDYNGVCRTLYRVQQGKNNGIR